MKSSSTLDKNELIEKRRKRKKIKRYMLLFILFISISITLCLKLPYFNIKSIEVENNRNISSDEIIKLSDIGTGKNIFYLDLQRSKTNITKNSYILSVKIRRKLPNIIKIHVEERTAVFYIKKGEKYFVVDKNGVILEEKELISGMKLIKLDGFDKNNYKVGEVINEKDGKKIKTIGQITELIKNLNEDIPEPSIVDLSDLTDIKVCYGNMVIKLGTSDDIDKKYNRAINILMYNKLVDKKGYIDVSYKGDPVFLVED
ncbi:FtsQ-type POTRA domain-containing protein [Clostridium bovifaecis]|uniref:FtsQ-type POTRA domain-containing protein n=1 Tax=Clostridium bovifaecis TaxID=2184719 RepID=A0A6I6F3C0_9CLOT|nr:FtsQ-type POTRA domain-containing protein [Clostridium bovifaecis]